ncbi:unnamed protein product [Adineta steineri]|uniref:RING-type E3 ubiquitin transferase n=1 Tax=Adineta steineri TaxID=433720 RepID=A0A818WWM2_9BILA|nr:unnamed protein product [Adineta steineri]CAF3732065.1 unnamed protein product [Adineta steineri]
MSIHHGISCDLCRKLNFSGRRYKCLICNDFDLCSICYDKNKNLSIQTHSIHHPMQLILTSNDYEHIYFGYIRTQRSPMSLTCPYCNQNGFSLNILIKHINEQHLISNYSIRCPICFTRQNHLAEHLHEHTENNLIIKTKTIKNLNSDEIQIKSTEKSLLEKLLGNHSNKNENNNQRYSFIHLLLTDLLDQKSFNKNVEINS